MKHANKLIIICYKTYKSRLGWLIRGGSAMILISKTGWGLQAHAARGAESGENR